LIIYIFHRPNLTFNPAKLSPIVIVSFVVFNLTFRNFCQTYILALASRWTKLHSVHLGITTTRNTGANRFQKRLFKFH